MPADSLFRGETQIFRQPGQIDTELARYLPGRRWNAGVMRLRLVLLSLGHEQFDFIYWDQRQQTTGLGRGSPPPGKDKNFLYTAGEFSEGCNPYASGFRSATNAGM